MKRFTNHRAVYILTLLVSSFFMLYGCGGGGGSAVVPGNPAVTGAETITGTAIKGPVHGATIRAYAIAQGRKGVELATAITDSLGNFMLSMPGYSGPIMLVLSGGTYTDEATGTNMPMGANDVMTALIPSIASGGTTTGIQITPLTSIAQTMAQGMASGMTTTNIVAANAAVGKYFMVSDILFTPPMNPLIADSGNGATQDMVNYGMTIAAMTQYANSIGLSDSSRIVTALMEDASDGIMNGMMGSTSISLSSGMGMMGSSTMMQSSAGTTGLADAMNAFTSSAMNRSGVAASTVQALITQLSTTNGVI